MTDPDAGDEVVHLEVEGGIAMVTLDSPENRNALSARLVDGLAAHLRTVGDDDPVRAVVLTHTGNTFCAGADLAEAAREGGLAKGTERLVALLRQILELPKPVIALVDGHVRAGGLGLLAACDLAVAGTSSTFAFTESRIGVAPAIISLTVLPRLGDRAASWAFLTGSTFDANRAEAIGLVTEATPEPQVALAQLTDALRAASPQGLAESKALLTAPLLAAFDARATEMTELSARLFASPEGQEGIAAFRERRPPWWATPG